MLHEEYMDDAAVKESILAEVDDKFDKRDGTLPDMVAGMVAPAIANIFITMAIDADESNASTASYAGLAQKIKERGLTLYPATKATFKAVALPNTLEIPTGTRLTARTNGHMKLDLT